MKDKDIRDGNSSLDSNSWHGTSPSTKASESDASADPHYFVMWSMRYVTHYTGMSARSVQREVFAGRFPEPVQLSPHRKAWRKSQVLEFLAGRRSWLSEPEPTVAGGTVPADGVDDDPFDFGVPDDLPDDPLEQEGPQLPDDDAGFPF